MSDEALPEPVEEANSTGPIPVENKEPLRSFLRITFAVCLGVLLMGDVTLYFLHESLKAQVSSHEYRIERLNGMVSDLMMANDNAEKIEKIEQQVNGINGQVRELTAVIKAQDTKAEELESKKR